MESSEENSPLLTSSSILLEEPTKIKAEDIDIPKIFRRQGIQKRLCLLQGKDRRQLVDIQNKHYSQYIGQIQTLKEKAEANIGSGILIQFKKEKFILTSAHVLIDYVINHKSGSQRQKTAKEAKFFQQREGTTKFKNELEMDYFSYCPEYEAKSRPNDGFDIALVGIKNLAYLSEENFYQLNETDYLENLNIQNGESISVVGYPEEEGKIGYQWEMDGVIERIQDVRDGENNQKLIFYNIDATQGQCGGPIFLRRDNKMILIGLHAGYDYGLNLNYGIALNEKIIGWISQNIGNLPQDLQILKNNFKLWIRQSRRIWQKRWTLWWKPDDVEWWQVHEWYWVYGRVVRREQGEEEDEAEQDQEKDEKVNEQDGEQQLENRISEVRRKMRDDFVEVEQGKDWRWWTTRKDNVDLVIFVDKIEGAKEWKVGWWILKEKFDSFDQNMCERIIQFILTGQ